MVEAAALKVVGLVLLVRLHSGTSGGGGGGGGDGGAGGGGDAQHAKPNLNSYSNLDRPPSNRRSLVHFTEPVGIPASSSTSEQCPPLFPAESLRGLGFGLDVSGSIWEFFLHSRGVQTVVTRLRFGKKLQTEK